MAAPLGLFKAYGWRITEQAGHILASVPIRRKAWIWSSRVGTSSPSSAADVASGSLAVSVSLKRMVQLRPARFAAYSAPDDPTIVQAIEKALV